MWAGLSRKEGFLVCLLLCCFDFKQVYNILENLRREGLLELTRSEGEGTDLFTQVLAAKLLQCVYLSLWRLAGQSYFFYTPYERKKMSTWHYSWLCNFYLFRHPDNRTSLSLSHSNFPEKVMVSERQNHKTETWLSGATSGRIWSRCEKNFQERMLKASALYFLPLPRIII